MIEWKPVIAFGFRILSEGGRLPITNVVVGSRTLFFLGRPGLRLHGAVERLQAEQPKAPRQQP